MSPQPASLLDALARRWRRRTQLVLAFRVLAASLPLCALVAAVASVPWPLLGLVPGIATAAVLVVRGLRPRSCERELVRHLDRAVPELQESSELLLASRELNLLERLQRQRLLEALRHVDAEALLPWRGVRMAAKWLAVSAAASAALWLWTPALSSNAVEKATTGTAGSPSAGADDAAAILRSVEVSIEPPAYTGRPARKVTGLDLEAEEGARLTWTLATAPEVDRAELVFDHATLALEKGDAVFAGETVAELPRLYYLRLASDGEEVFRSSYARLEVVPDTPPALDVLAPEPFVEVDPKRPGRLELALEASDDYGLGATAVRATLASGTGEMVEFREERYELTSRERLDDHAFRLGRVLDLEALGLEPGSELYFFVEAFDNREPEPNYARTATHIVRAPGGAGLSVELGEGIPMLTLPDYFRSQRQIIIDTEKLIADREQITEKELRQRSQELGFDQGALRTRYGTLLGLESEDGRPLSEREIAAAAAEEPEEGDDEHAEEEGEFESEAIRRLLEELPEDLVHLHDSAEVSTFFTSEVKTLLKASIRQMWDAELHLRLFAPGEALPYEHRALKLLKLAQQAERVYVERIGFDAPVVKPREKRLTGELDDVASQRHRFETETAPALPEVRRALEIVDARRRDPSSTPEDFAAVMEAAARVLARRAVEERDLELAALDELRQWIATGETSDERLAAIERALWRLLPEPPAHPAPRQASPGSLYERYRRRLGDGG